MTNPYQGLDDTKFWRTAIASRSAYDNHGQIWQPKFEISRQSKIIAAGSCFAQHVGKWFTQNSFNFRASKIDNKHNFSFATGNIYTPALLKQWLQVASGTLNLNHVYDEIDGRFFDLLRPAVQEKGFSSLEELLTARNAMVEEMKRFIEEADIFIFTLGLTEAWHHSDGTVYPMCPGTMVGKFDPSLHKFINFTFEETKSTMEDALSLVRSFNKNICFLLSVSPVPLTATASEDHILSATVYSKSVLRSCAGQLAKANADVDYFPSYELITTHPDNGEFFESNRRTVNSVGVSYVMAQLEASLSSDATSKVQSLERKLKKTPTLNRKIYANEEAVCEEIYLDQWSHDKQLDKPPRFCLIGDSQMAMISNVLDDMDIPYIGGMVMNGQSWGTGEVVPDRDELFVPLESKITRTLWSSIHEQLVEYSDEEATKPVIVTNLGMHIRATMVAFADWMNRNGIKELELEQGLNFIREYRSKHIAILKNFAAAGYKFLMVTDPPLQKFYDNATAAEPVANVYEKLYEIFVQEVGGDYLNMRTLLTEQGGIKKSYISEVTLKTGAPDLMHGSTKYYQEVTKAIVKIYEQTLALTG